MSTKTIEMVDNTQESKDEQKINKQKLKQSDQLLLWLLRPAETRKNDDL